MAGVCQIRGATAPVVPHSSGAGELVIAGATGECGESRYGRARVLSGERPGGRKPARSRSIRRCVASASLSTCTSALCCAVLAVDDGGDVRVTGALRARAAREGRAGAGVADGACDGADADAAAGASTFSGVAPVARALFSGVAPVARAPSVAFVAGETTAAGFDPRVVGAIGADGGVAATAGGDPDAAGAFIGDAGNDESACGAPSLATAWPGGLAPAGAASCAFDPP